MSMRFLPWCAASLLLAGLACQAQMRIGQTAGFSGPVAAGVKETTEGAQLYLDAVNAAGGIRGQKIELLSLDDKFEPKLAAANAEKLIVEQNVAFGLVAQRQPKAEITQRVANALALVRMQDYGGRRISALSGGQQQRVAVARAIVVKPTLLLLDEPFSALDRKLRETMQIEMRHLLRELGITSIFVTHDQDEALVMSDRIAVMNNGRIEQLGTPAEVYGQPSTLHVLEFVGQSTRLAGHVREAGGPAGDAMAVETPLGVIRVPPRDSGPMSGPVILGVRPECIAVGEATGPDFNRVRARLTDVVFFGAKTALHFQPPGAEDRLQAEVSRVPENLAPGADVVLNWPVRETMVYPAP